MALLKCPDCGKDVSDKASACVHCGCPVSAMKTKQTAGAKQTVVSKTQGTFLSEFPKEMPEAGLGLGVIVTCIEKLCGVCGYAGISAAVLAVARILYGSMPSADLLLLAVLGIVGGSFVADLLNLFRFLRVRRYLRTYLFEGDIRTDMLPEMTITKRAYGLCSTMLMVRYIKKLNPFTGNVLEISVKNARKRQWKKRWKHVPYLAVLAAIYYLGTRLLWLFIYDETVCLIVTHLLTLVVMCVFGAREEWAPKASLAVAAIFAPTIFAYYMESMWYHIAICAAVAFIGMFIGSYVKPK